MKELTAEQRELVENNMAAVDRHMYFLTRNIYSFEDATSIGRVWLCELAQTYDASTNVPFLTYVKSRMGFRLSDHFRSLLGRRITQPYLKERVDLDMRLFVGESKHVTENKVIASILMQKLTERQRFVVNKYFYEGHSLMDIGGMLDITESRTSQILSSALEAMGRQKKQRTERNKPMVMKAAA